MDPTEIIEGMLRPAVSRMLASQKKIEVQKTAQRSILDQVDALKGDAEVDQRMLAIARTQIELGFLALEKAISMRPYEAINALAEHGIGKRDILATAVEMEPGAFK